MKPDELSFHRRWLTLMDAINAARIGDRWPVKACSPPTGHLSKKTGRLPSVERLNELLVYDSQLPGLHWRTCRGRRGEARTGTIAATWNAVTPTVQRARLCQPRRGATVLVGIAAPNQFNVPPMEHPWPTVETAPLPSSGTRS
jgi:hypothetical protein